MSGVGTSFSASASKTGIAYTLPATVSIDTANIGGPSAGLAMTLTLIDKLSRQSISGNRPIAATGTIDVHGDVGDVGGVAEKTVAVQRAGAKYFFVPAGRGRDRESGRAAGSHDRRRDVTGPGAARPSSPRRRGPATPYAAPLSHFRQVPTP